MSRTKRYVPHWVREQELHPYIDPESQETYYWRRNAHEKFRASQMHKARLRGDDGKNPSWKRDFWVNPMDAVRTDYRRLIAEGVEDHFDALEDEGWEFDWQGNQTNDLYDDYEDIELPDWWYDSSLDEKFYPDCDEPEDEPEIYDSYDWYDPYDDYGSYDY